MDIPLQLPIELPRGDNQIRFLDQLNAMLRAIATSSSGSAGADSAGNYYASSTSDFSLPRGVTSLSVAIVKDSNGLLKQVDVTPIGIVAENSNWKAEISAMVTSALGATLAKRQATFFRRATFNYIGQALEGEYWLPGFRLAPIIADEPEPALMSAERVIVVDMNVTAIDDHHASALAIERGRRVAARLSLILGVGLYATPHEHRWYSIMQNGALVNARHRLGYATEQPLAMPKKSQLCELGSCNGSIAEPRRWTSDTLQPPKESLHNSCRVMSSSGV
jgi:hypothetical protein